MEFKVGERVAVESKTTGKTPRRGKIEEVLRGEPHPRYRMRWDDGHESLYTPSAGELKREAN